MTLKQKILNKFDTPNLEASCVTICEIIRYNDRQENFTQSDWVRLNASVSSQICKFVKAGILEVVPDKKGPLGGQIYRKTKPDEKTVSILEGLVDQI